MKLIFDKKYNQVTKQNPRDNPGGEPVYEPWGGAENRMGLLVRFGNMPWCSIKKRRFWHALLHRKRGTNSHTTGGSSKWLDEGGKLYYGLGVIQSQYRETGLFVSGVVPGPPSPPLRHRPSASATCCAISCGWGGVGQGIAHIHSLGR